MVQGKPVSGRRRIDSIVPGQQLAQVPAAMREPSWISGTKTTVVVEAVAETEEVEPEVSAGTAAGAAVTGHICSEVGRQKVAKLCSEVKRKRYYG